MIRQKVYMGISIFCIVGGGSRQVDAGDHKGKWRRRVKLICVEVCNVLCHYDRKS